jgi:hypothetical protein
VALGAGRGRTGYRGRLVYRRMTYGVRI